MKNLGLIAKASAAALVLTAGLMTGCGSSGGSSTKTGVFHDAVVSGISYSTSSGKEGVTDADGKFQYKKGDTVTFSIGGIVFPGGIPQDGIITPAHLAGTADWEDDATAVNIIQFLLSIDEDGDAENGIQIPAGLADYINENEITIEDWAAVDFDSELSTFITNVNIALEITLVVIDETDAKLHFNATIDALGITIEIQVSSDVEACNNQNTAEIQASYELGELLTKVFEVAVEPTPVTTVVVEEGSVLTVNDVVIDGTCTFADTSVTTGEITVTALTWIWTDGTDTYTITDNGYSLTYTSIVNSETTTGTLSPAAAE